MTVLELTRRILAIMHSNVDPEILNRADNEIREQLLNPAKARDIFKWAPLFTLEQGLDKTIAWYKDFFASEMQAI